MVFLNYAMSFRDTVYFFFSKMLYYFGLTKSRINTIIVDILRKFKVAMGLDCA